MTDEKKDNNWGLNELKHFLMIDDDQVCLMGIEMLLFNTGFTLISALGGKEGLKYLLTYPKIDLILLDMMMPEINGLALLEIIKQDDYLRKIPVILQTGMISGVEIEKAYALGVVSVLRKPYTQPMLLREITKALARSNKET
jgi:two-component system sensor histidine kinase ChiS